MDALVVYESLYGNTARIARAIGEGLTDRGIPAEVVGVDAIDPAVVARADLLVVGGPTHAHGLSKEATRAQAVADADNTFDAPTAAVGVRDGLEALPDGAGRAAAAFDTRIGAAPAILTGSAAKGIARRLKGRGYRLVADPESFLVTAHSDLVDGEVERAVRWGASVAEALGVLR
ncbi:MAG: flavodoxin domain-containing protein [Actinomycetota bacterium]